MKTIITVFAFMLYFGANPLFAQKEHIDPEIPMQKLSFMAGEWEGTAWMMTREGKQFSKVKETVEHKLDNHLLIVEGLGTKIDSVTNELIVVHKAFGVIFFDSESNSLTMRAYKNDGVAVSKIEFIEEKVIRWILDTPNGGKVRFTVDFKTENKWIEVGEFSRDNEHWMNYLGMELTKVD